MADQSPAHADQHWRFAQNETLPDISGPPVSSGGILREHRPYSFGRDIGTVGWEAAAVFLEMTATRLPKAIRRGDSFTFADDHFFGQGSYNLGMDKVVHGYKAYVITDVFQQLIERKTGDRKSAAVTSALLTFGLMLYGEAYDGLDKDNGFSYRDKLASTVGIGISLLRNTVPGIEETFDIRQLRRNTGRFSEQKYLVALQLSGFKGLEESPLRFIELQSGYYVNDFKPGGGAGATTRNPKRHFFVGIGLNLQEIFFKTHRSRLSRWAWTALNYVQIPYTAAHVDVK